MIFLFALLASYAAATSPPRPKGVIIMMLGACVVIEERTVKKDSDGRRKSDCRNYGLFCSSTLTANALYDYHGLLRLIQRICIEIERDREKRVKKREQRPDAYMHVSRITYTLLAEFSIQSCRMCSVLPSNVSSRRVLKGLKEE